MHEYDRYKRAELYKNTRRDDKKSQKDMCLDYLEQYDTITPIEALVAFGSFRLSALICELRKEGYVITTTLNDCKPRYAIYTLIREGEEYDA